MDILTSIKVFQRVVACGSFTKAAEDLNISIAMASKHVTSLENHLQTRLLMRTSRRLHLTEAGRQYVEESGQALGILEQAARNAGLGIKKPGGILKITAPTWLAIPQFCVWLAEYQALYPDVILSLHLENKRVDMVADGYDLALRVSNDLSPSLIVKPLGIIPFYFVASPDYLNTSGIPQTPEDLNRHRSILPTYTDINHFMALSDEPNQWLNLQVAVYSSDTLLSCHLARAGMGVAYLPLPIVENDLATGKLKRLLPDYELTPATLYAAYINRQYLSAKVRTFIDFLAEKIKDITLPETQEIAE